MAGNVFRMIELVGTSSTSIEDAVNSALATCGAKAALRWFQIVETRGALKDGKVAEWQVTVKVGQKEG